MRCKIDRTWSSGWVSLLPTLLIFQLRRSRVSLSMVSVRTSLLLGLFRQGRQPRRKSEFFSPAIRIPFPIDSIKFLRKDTEICRSGGGTSRPDIPCRLLHFSVNNLPKNSALVFKHLVQPNAELVSSAAKPQARYSRDDCRSNAKCNHRDDSQIFYLATSLQRGILSQVLYRIHLYI